MYRKRKTRENKERERGVYTSNVTSVETTHLTVFSSRQHWILNSGTEEEKSYNQNTTPQASRSVASEQHELMATLRWVWRLNQSGLSQQSIAIRLLFLRGGSKRPNAKSSRNTKEIMSPISEYFSNFFWSFTNFPLPDIHKLMKVLCTPII